MRATASGTATPGPTGVALITGPRLDPQPVSALRFTGHSFAHSGFTFRLCFHHCWWSGSEFRPTVPSR